jgi:predicted alternative tryptophan synthase beta-subunit
MSTTRFVLTEDDLPRQWYNMAPDRLIPLLPPLRQANVHPVFPAGLSPLFPLESGLIEARAVNQLAAFEMTVHFARSEGTLTAPEKDYECPAEAIAMGMADLPEVAAR